MSKRVLQLNKKITMYIFLFILWLWILALAIFLEEDESPVAKKVCIFMAASPFVLGAIALVLVVILSKM